MRSSHIIRSDDLRSENRLRLLDTLRIQGPTTPTRLGELTGLSAASISTLSSQLTDQGIARSERDPGSAEKGTRGRPRTQLSLDADAAYAVTVNLIIDRITTRCVDYTGAVLSEDDRELDTRALTTTELLDSVVHGIEQVCAGGRGANLRHVGVAFQGMTTHTHGNLLWSPIIQVQNVPLGDYLRDQLGVSVSVNNDCRLISEALNRDHTDTLGQSFATVLFSYGIGLGLHLDGQSFAGSYSSALEIGHLRFERNGALCRCGKRGCIEAYAADYGIERLANSTSIQEVPMGRISHSHMTNLINSAHAGEQAAIQAFTIAGAAVGEGLATLFTLFDPMPVALVGRSQAALDLMRGGINTILEQQLRSEINTDSLLFCFDNQDPLLDYGLLQYSLSQIDHQFSDPHTNHLMGQ